MIKEVNGNVCQIETINKESNYKKELNGNSEFENH